MVFTTPNQLSLVSQKVRFLTLFGHLLAPKMLTFGTPWLPEGAKSAPRGLPKAHPKKDSQKRVSRKPVLAREREARFYFGALADQLACIVEKLEERSIPPAFPSISQNPPAFTQHSPSIFPKHSPSTQHSPAFPSIPQHSPAFPQQSLPSIPQHPQHSPALPSIPPPFPRIPQHSPAFPSIPQHS